MLDEILRGPKIFKLRRADVIAIMDDCIASTDKVLPEFMARAEHDRADGFFRDAVDALQADRKMTLEAKVLVDEGPWEMSYEEVASIKNRFSTKKPAAEAEREWEQKTARAVKKSFESALESAFGTLR